MTTPTGSDSTGSGGKKGSKKEESRHGGNSASQLNGGLPQQKRSQSPLYDRCTCTCKYYTLLLSFIIATSSHNNQVIQGSHKSATTGRINSPKVNWYSLYMYTTLYYACVIVQTSASPCIGCVYILPVCLWAVITRIYFTWLLLYINFVFLFPY